MLFAGEKSLPLLLRNNFTVKREYKKSTWVQLFSVNFSELVNLIYATAKNKNMAFEPFL